MKLSEKTLNPKLEAIKAKYRHGVTDEIIGEFVANENEVERLVEEVMK